MSTRELIVNGVPKPPKVPARSRPEQRKQFTTQEVAQHHGRHMLDTPIVQLVRGDQVKLTSVSWLWRQNLARGKIHLIAGPPGIGKTTTALSLASIVTAGGKWPDGTSAQCGSVLIWSGEDDVSDTLAPRLAAMGADMARVLFVSSVALNGRTIAFDPARHMEQLRDAARDIKDLMLILVDPVVAAIQGDSHKNAEVRRGLAPLQEFAEATDVAVIGITHFTKGTQSRDPVERITGSLAFAAVARIVFVSARRKDEQDCVFLRAKNNLGPSTGGFAYAVKQCAVPGVKNMEASVVEWGKTIEGEAREILDAAEGSGEDGSRFGDAKDFLRDLLTNGPLPTRQIMNEARGAGHSEQTIRRAKTALAVEAVKEIGSRGQWKWSLP